MVRSRDKTATAVPAAKASGRGKNRFNPPSKTNRTVLPSRPPRHIDSEIVSILLGADPSSLIPTPDQPQGTILTPKFEPIGDVQPLPELILTDSDNRLTSLQQLQTPDNPLTDLSGDFMGEALVSRSNVESHQAESIENDTISALQISQPSRSFVGDRKSSISELENTPLPFPSNRVAPDSVNASNSLQTNATGYTPEILQSPQITSFDEFTLRWKHGLRKGQLKVCEILWNKTYALGRSSCITSFSELSRLSGLQIRQCFNVISQLESLKFVEREKNSSTSNKKDQGSVIHFYHLPKS